MKKLLYFLSTLFFLLLLVGCKENSAVEYDELILSADGLVSIQVYDSNDTLIAKASPLIRHETIIVNPDGSPRYNEKPEEIFCETNSGIDITYDYDAENITTVFPAGREYTVAFSSDEYVLLNGKFTQMPQGITQEFSRMSLSEGFVKEADIDINGNVKLYTVNGINLRVAWFFKDGKEMYFATPFVCAGILALLILAFIKITKTLPFSKVMRILLPYFIYVFGIISVQLFVYFFDEANDALINYLIYVYLLGITVVAPFVFAILWGRSVVKKNNLFSAEKGWLLMIVMLIYYLAIRVLPLRFSIGSYWRGFEKLWPVSLGFGIVLSLVLFWKEQEDKKSHSQQHRKYKKR